MLTIQQMARETGLSVHTLRYYEKIGLIDPVPRGPGGQRRYRDSDQRWIAFLLRLRDTGMSVADMQRYADWRRQGQVAASLMARRELLESHREALLEHMRILTGTLAVLDDKIAVYREWEAAAGDPNHDDRSQTCPTSSTQSQPPLHVTNEALPD